MENLGEMGEVMSKIVWSIMSLLIGVLATYVFAVQTQRAEMLTAIGNLETLVAERTTDRYRGEEAKKDFATVNLQIETNAEHIRELQQLMRQHSQNRNLHN